jgi:hypothetical protein
VKLATACRSANYCRDTIYIRDDSSRDVLSSKTARIIRVRPETEEEARIKQQGHWMPDDATHARCQMPEMSETVRKTQVNNSRVFAETRKNLVKTGKIHEKDN